MPLRLVPSILWLTVAAAGLVGLFWLIDTLRDGAKAEVRLEYVEAARKKNVEIGDYNSADDALSALVEAAVAAQAAKAKTVASTCTATPAQATALTALRRIAP